MVLLKDKVRNGIILITQQLCNNNIFLLTKEFKSVNRKYVSIKPNIRF